LGVFFEKNQRKKQKNQRKKIKNQRKKILKQRVSKLFLNFANYE
jgi:hypothetical protein